MNKPPAFRDDPAVTVSVCMATYNGARFLREQLDSVLSQLGEGDELVVSDDGSTDATLEIISGLADPRVRQVGDGRRRGYVGNFERALQSARGELVFLCDQDDIWAPEKLRRMRAAFAARPDVAMAHHERRLIDAEGSDLGPGPRLGDGVAAGLGFVLREGVKARMWGCALAMRRRALDRMLPFPRSVYAHDHWATIVGGLAGGILLVPEPLIFHRLHGANVTPKNGLPWSARVVVRLRYGWMVCVALARGLRKGGK
ncbi:glycosyltransferase family 2 protein [Uliginosibacterium sp. H1]|uniref:glycosyltransferase family 2 protein n=1 Tax=Uliginosibacterium sp. H1 TaxID=3114757 RepID=UPI002E17FC91|nr:glycosyltransferase family 2 protein [Uliginosibacterium sp. H1]